MGRLLQCHIICILMLGCSPKEKDAFLFELVPAEYSGIHFQNSIIENDSINVIDFQYCYNGGGVGVGDFNNDGLEDVFFTGNQVSSKLYLNKGELKFEDVTAMANVTTSSWVTGVSIIDINADGYDDIYLNVGGANCQGNCQNLLFINQGVQNSSATPTFKEMASEYGLDESEYAQQTVFFDYDLDGDLDAFIARNGNVAFDKNSPIPKQFYPEHLTDVLLENIQPKHLDHPYFVDVSKQVGVDKKGFALGLGIADFNNDNLPDIYVGNDFITNDLLYVNGLKDSANYFSESSAKYFKHHTYNSMGLDISDINNDGHQDLMVLDMLPFTNERRKLMLGVTNYDKYQLGLNNGYTPQFVRNTLHMHSGAIEGKSIAFQELGFHAGIAATDWSWAPLFADFDLDADKDLLVTNGYGKDVTDLDFINFSVQNNMFGTHEARDKKIKELLANRPRVMMPNFFYSNVDGTSFKDVSNFWTSQPESISNGAAFADFDNDGDLDIVVNNIDQKAFVLKNNAQLNAQANYLKINLNGPKNNNKGIGTTLKVWANGTCQTHYQSVIRGYLSSVSSTAFFGLQTSSVDSIQVRWPDGKEDHLKNIAANQTLSINYKNATAPMDVSNIQMPLLFSANNGILPITHQENPSNDYVFQHLLPTQHSKMGPCLASSTDGKFLFVGGSHGFPGQVYGQLADGTLRLIQELEDTFEDTEATFIDFDGDGDLDLYVASGGSEQQKNAEVYQDRLYENQENRFTLTEGIIPVFKESTSCVVPIDFDQDGDMDLFVGSNIVPREYPTSPQQTLLENKKGVFSVSQTWNDLGMVSDAVSEDIDGDGWMDLLLVGDWSPITIVKNTNGKLLVEKATYRDKDHNTLDTSGWWKSVSSGDFDHDGDIDFLLGNLGTNNFINPSQEYQVHIYAGDYDQNGSVDPIIGAYQTTAKGKRLMPLNSRDDVTKQVVSLKNRYLSYEAFGNVDYKTLLEIQDLEEKTLKVSQSESVLLENNGNLEFTLKPLPSSCQLAPINTILVDDFDSDGHLDALLAGNDFQAEPQFGRYDALNGIFLRGDGEGNFQDIPSAQSGFFVPGQCNQLVKMKTANGQTLILAGQNNDSLQVFRLNKTLIQ